MNFYAEKCFGEVSCTIEDLTRFIMNGTKVTYFFGYSEFQESPAYAQDIAQCNDISTRFFIQYMCKQTKEDIYAKTKKADFCIWVAISTAIFVTLYAEYCKYLVRKLALDHDIMTVTPSDYTLHMYLNEKQSQAFENFYMAQKLLTTLPRGEVFMLWLKREFALFSDD